MERALGGSLTWIQSLIALISSVTFRSLLNLASQILWVLAGGDMTYSIGLLGDIWDRIFKSVKLGSRNVNRCLVNLGFPCLLVLGKPSSRNGAQTHALECWLHP